MQFVSTCMHAKISNTSSSNPIPRIHAASVSTFTAADCACGFAGLNLRAEQGGLRAGRVPALSPMWQPQLRTPAPGLFCAYVKPCLASANYSEHNRLNSTESSSGHVAGI